MQMAGEQLIAAPRERVWKALNDAAILQVSIPGCRSLEQESPERLKAVVEVKIGPIGARFAGAVTLSELDPPNGYNITGEGQGGTVGSAKGGAKVRLTERGGQTLLTYEVDAQVGGRLAQLGGPIIDATAKQLAAKFFKSFGEAVGAPAVSAGAPSAAPATPPGYSAPSSGGLPAAWLLALPAAALAGFLAGRGLDPGGVGPGTELWMGLALGLLVTLVAAAGFAFGRRMAAPVVVLDAALLARLAEAIRT